MNSVAELLKTVVDFDTGVDTGVGVGFVVGVDTGADVGADVDADVDADVGVGFDVGADVGVGVGVGFDVGANADVDAGPEEEAPGVSFVPPFTIFIGIFKILAMSDNIELIFSSCDSTLISLLCK